MDIELPPDFKELLSLFRTHGVDYMLIGGYAVATYGYSRTTMDIDLWIARNQDNAERVVSAMTEFGFGSDQLRPALFLHDHGMVRIGAPPLKVEILTSISGIDYEAARPNAVTYEWDGAVVSVIAYDDLITNKKASARPRDLADIHELEKKRNRKR